MGHHCRNNRNNNHKIQTNASMILLEFHRDNVANDRAINRLNNEHSDIVDLAIDHLPKNGEIVFSKILMNISLKKMELHNYTFGHNDISDSMNVHERISPSHLVLFLSK